MQSIPFSCGLGSLVWIWKMLEPFFALWFWREWIKMSDNFCSTLLEHEPLSVRKVKDIFQGKSCWDWYTYFAIIYKKLTAKSAWFFAIFLQDAGMWFTSTVPHPKFAFVFECIKAHTIWINYESEPCLNSDGKTCAEGSDYLWLKCAYTSSANDKWRDFYNKKEHCII